MALTTPLNLVDVTEPADRRTPSGSGDDCCSLASGPLDVDDAQRSAERFKALADPMRLRLLAHVAAQGCDAVCACDLTGDLGISQSTVSHHMKKLVDAGLLTREQRGRWAHYTVVPEAFADLRGLLEIG